MLGFCQLYEVALVNMGLLPSLVSGWCRFVLYGAGFHPWRWRQVAVHPWRLAVGGHSEYCGKLVECGQVVFTKFRKGCGWRRIAQGINEVYGGFDDCVSRGQAWHRTVTWKKFDRSAGAFSGGFGYVEPIVAIVFSCWSKVPATFSVCCPRAALCRGFVEDYVGAWGRHWGAIIVKWAVELGIG